MAAILFDLDDTLVDRAGAFARWARDFAARAGVDAEVLIELDERGYVSRTDFFARVRTEYPHVGEELVTDFADGLPRAVQPHSSVKDALQSLEVPWAVVTNGSVLRQEAKCQAAGLDIPVDRLFTSEGVGAAKPDAKIFEVALQVLGVEPEDAWFVGDHPHNDIEGAARVGMRTCWLHHGRSWPTGGRVQPNAVAATLLEALERVR